MDGREPKAHEDWTFGEDGVTPGVHPTARFDIGAGFVSEFLTNYLTEDGIRIPMFGRKSINGIFEWLSVSAPLRTDVPPWTDNILVPGPAWGYGGTATNSNWGSQPDRPYGSVFVLWIGPIRVMPAYVCRSLENMRSAPRRICDNIL